MGSLYWLRFHANLLVGKLVREKLCSPSEAQGLRSLSLRAGVAGAVKKRTDRVVAVVSPAVRKVIAGDLLL